MKPTRVACLAVAVAALCLAPRPEARQDTRGWWVVRTTLTSPAGITRLVADARVAGINTLIVQVRGRGDAYYRSTLEPRAAALRGQPASFDPLASVITAAHAAGIRVHAWMNVGLVASAHDLPSSRQHIANRHPQWLMVPRQLAASGRGATPSVRQLASWTRRQPGDVEGLFLSPLNPDATSHVVDLVRDLGRRYEIDGLHLDYIRYPTADYDYGPVALREFRRSVVADLAPDERARLDNRLAREPFLYTDMFPTRWTAFRRSRLTSLVMRIRTTLAEVRPGAQLTVAAVADQDTALNLRLQDWPAWAQARLVDAVCPMAYTQNADTFATQVADAVRAAGPTPVWAGVGAYRLTSAQTASNALAARQLGAQGVLLFSYDSLAEAAVASPGVFAEIGRALAAGAAASAR